MNGFESACAIEAQGMAILLPYLEERSDRLVLNLKGALARYLQLVVGDAIVNVAELTRSVEIKVERRHTGRLFLETWSNRNLDERTNHAGRGSNPGWLVHSGADVLLYYFIDTDDLYTVDMFSLKRWAFGFADNPGNIYKFDEIAQGKYQQKNDTLGRCVPVAKLAADLKRAFKHCKVKQIPLFDAA